MNSNNQQQQQKEQEEFQIDTSTKPQQVVQLQKQNSIKSDESNSSDQQSFQNSGIDQFSETETIDSNIVNFFSFPERLESIQFQIKENFTQELDNLISEEEYHRIIQVILNHIQDKKIIAKNEIEKIEKLNNENNYINNEYLQQILGLQTPLSYYMQMAKIQGESRAITRISNILLQEDRQKVQEVFKRCSLHNSLIIQLLYHRMRLKQNEIGRFEKAFICSIGNLWQGLYDETFNLLKQKNLISDIYQVSQNKAGNIQNLITDLERGKYNKHKQETIKNKNRIYSLSKNDMQFYMDSFQQYNKSLNDHRKLLASALKPEICAQCGLMLNLANLGIRQHFKRLATLNGLCRGEIKFPEYRDQIIFNQCEDGQKLYKVCYSCNKNEFQPDDNEVEEDQPNQIKKISKKQQEAMIRLGHIYSKIQNFEATMYSAMHGDTSFELFNANIGLMVKNLQWRWMQVLSHDQKNRIDEALTYLKQNNHLYGEKGYLSTYELWQEMASNKEFEQLIQDKQLNVRNRMFRGYAQNTFILELPDEEEEGLYLMPRNVHESGHEFLHLKDLKNLPVFEEYQKDDQKQKSEIVQDALTKFEDNSSKLDLEIRRNTVYYGDKFLDEKLFPTLFFKGYGGYNSTYLEYGVTFATYAKMKLLSIRPFYRKNQDYIHMAIDRKRKEQLIGFSRGFKAVNQKQHEKQLTKKDVLTHRDPMDKSAYYFAQRGSRKIVGSPQYFIARGEEAQAMVQYAQKEYDIDHPHLFITLTLNPAGEDVIQIKERINRQQKRNFQDPLAENIAFYLKSRQAVKMVLGSTQQQGIFGKVLQHIERIEFQKRGAPHLHMIIWLDKEDANRLQDGYAVQAVVPQQDEDLKQLVLKYMKHTCNEFYCELSKNKGRCKRGYPMPLSETNHTNENDLYVYKRLTEEDRWIVPYNPMILKLMRSNCCVEIMTERESITYLTKYVTKAEPSMNINLIEKYQQAGRDQKEVLKFLKLGVISIHQSMWQICKFPMFQMSPQVIYLNISTPNQKMRLLKDDKDLVELDDNDIDIFKDGPYERYLVRPLQIEELTFFEFMEKYRYCFKEKDVPRYAKNEIIKSRVQGYEKIIYYKRKSKVIISATKLFPNDGETFFFRVYLENVPHRKYRDFHYANKEKSFYIECIIRNLIQMNIKNDYSSKKFFWEQAKFNKKLMQQVLLQIIRDKALGTESINSIDHQISHIQSILDEEEVIQEQMSFQKDIDPKQKKSFLEQIFNQEQIDKYFMKTFDFNQKAEKVLTLYTINQLEQQYLSNDQIAALECIYYRCFIEKKQGLFFITGGAGVGKTHFIKLLYSILLNVLKQKVVMTASTGIAAGNVYGQTLHSLFKLSGADSESNIDPLSRMQKYLQNIDFIIIDEISQLGEKTFDKVQDICQRTEMRKFQRDQVFGGKNIILCGDLLQTMFSKDNPLSSGDLFLKNFEWIVLQENFRQKGDISFQQLLNRIRIGDQSEQDLDILNNLNITKESKEFASFIQNHNAQVLAGTNKLKDQYNDQIRNIKILSGTYMDEQILEAKNFKTKKNTKLLQETNQKHQEYLEILESRKEIKLKNNIKIHVGGQIMITRNFDINFQMANGQLCNLIEIGPDQQYLKVFNHKTKSIQIIGRHTDQVTYKQRRLQRYQFAIQQAYANTIHKVQGLGFDYLIVDCQNLFSNGQAYTAFSRITNLKGLRLINFKKEEIKTSNFYKEMYTERTKVWNEKKESILQLKKDGIFPSILHKLKDMVSLYDKDVLNEIRQQLDKINLNIMLETNFNEFADNNQVIQKRKQPTGDDDELEEEKILLNDEDDLEMTSDSKAFKRDHTMSQDSLKQFELFFNKVRDMQILSPADKSVKKEYPFIKWWNNSCYHDSFMHCFYFGIWRQNNSQLQDETGIREIVQACKTLDTIPFEKEYLENNANRCNCERQMQAVQVLRRNYGLRNDLCGNEQLIRMIQQNSLFESELLEKNLCNTCTHSNGDKIYKIQKIVLDQIVNFNIQDTFNQLGQDGIAFPCEICALESDYKNIHFIRSPKYLLVDINLIGLTPLKLQDIEIRTTNNLKKNYELFGIIAFDKDQRNQHYISFLKNGIYDEQRNMNGWWRYNGLDKGKNMKFICNSNQELEGIMTRDHNFKFIPNLMIYRYISE